MNQNTLSFLQFLGIALAVSTIAHSLSRRTGVASGIAAVVSAVLTIAFWSVRQGYFDGWYVVGFFTLTAVGAGVAFAVGFIFRRVRRRREARRATRARLG